MKTLPPASGNKMRYFVTGVTVEQVKAIGGKDIKATRIGIFVTLTAEQANKLVFLGARVKPVQEVKSSILPPIVAPPTPVAAQPTYSPYALTYAAGFEEIREDVARRHGIPVDGSGISVAVVGSGIRDTHELLNGRVVAHWNYTAEPLGDQFDHDTGVASLVVAVAPMCNILDFKVLDHEGRGTDEQVVEAIDDIITMHEEGDELAPDVVNLSLGAPDVSYDSALRAISREAVDRNIFLVASAGNSGPGPGTITSPACERYVFAIGSVDPIIDEEGNITGFGISQFSSRGPNPEGYIKPDVVFFGRDVILASSASDTATKANTGTSFAAPFISGACTVGLQVAAQIMGSPEVPLPMTPVRLIDEYMPMFSIKPSEAPRGKDNDYGWGMPYGPLAMQKIRAMAMTAMISQLVEGIIPVGIMGVMMGAFVPVIKEAR